MSFPDGFVNGSINGVNSTHATVNASVSCVDSMPTGTLSGSVEFPSEQFVRKFTFNSDSPFVVATINSDGLQSVGAAFDNVTVQENTFTPMTDCTAYLNATRITSDSWVGSFVIVCPNGEKLFIYGVFTGPTKAKRTGFCRPLL